MASRNKPSASETSAAPTPHTPGPWQVGNVGHDHRVFITSANPNEIVGLAEDFNEYARDDERDANARLIAAAPELLELVRTVPVFGRAADTWPAWKERATETLEALRS